MEALKMYGRPPIINSPFFPPQPHNVPRRREFTPTNSSSGGPMSSSFVSNLPYDSTEYPPPWPPVNAASTMNGYSSLPPPPPPPPLPPLPRYLTNPPPPPTMNSTFQQFLPPPPGAGNFSSSNTALAGFQHHPPISPLNSPPLAPVVPQMQSGSANGFGPPPVNQGQLHMPPPPPPPPPFHSIPPPIPLSNQNYNHLSHQIPPPPNFSPFLNNSFSNSGSGPLRNGPNQGNNTYMTPPVSAPGSPSPHSNQAGYCGTTPPPPVGTQGLQPLILSPSLPMTSLPSFPPRLGQPHGPISQGPPTFSPAPSSHPLKTSGPRQASNTPSPALSKSTVSSGQSSSASPGKDRIHGQASPAPSSPKPKLNPNASAFTPVIKSPAIVSSTPPPPPRQSNPIVSSSFGKPVTPPQKVKSPLNPFSVSFTPTPAQSRRSPNERPKFNPAAPDFVPISESPPPPSKSPPSATNAPARTAPPPTGPSLRYSKLPLSPPTGPSAHKPSLPPRPNIVGVNIFEQRGLPPTTPTGPKAMSIPSGPRAMTTPNGPRSMTPTAPRSMTPTAPRSMAPIAPRAMTPSGLRAQASSGILGSKYAIQPQIDLTGLKKPPPIAPAAMLTPTGKLPPTAPAAMLSRMNGSRRGLPRSTGSSVRGASTHGARTPSESERSVNGDVKQELKEETIKIPATPTEEEDIVKPIVEEIVIEPSMDDTAEIPVAEIKLDEEPQSLPGETDTKESIDDPTPNAPDAEEASGEILTTLEVAPPAAVVDDIEEDEFGEFMSAGQLELVEEIKTPQSEEGVIVQPINIEDAKTEPPFTPMPEEVSAPIPAIHFEAENSAPRELDVDTEIDKTTKTVSSLRYSIIETPRTSETKVEKETDTIPSVRVEGGVVVVPMDIAEITKDEKETVNAGEAETSGAEAETNGIYTESPEPKLSTAPRPSPESALTTRQKPQKKKSRRNRKGKAQKSAPTEASKTPAVEETEEKDDGAPTKKAKSEEVVQNLKDDAKLDNLEMTEAIADNVFKTLEESTHPITEAEPVTLPIALEATSKEGTTEEEEHSRSPVTLEEHDHEREHDGGVKLDLTQEAPAPAVVEVDKVEEEIDQAEEPIVEEEEKREELGENAQANSVAEIDIVLEKQVDETVEPDTTVDEPVETLKPESIIDEPVDDAVTTEVTTEAQEDAIVEPEVATNEQIKCDADVEAMTEQAEITVKQPEDASEELEQGEPAVDPEVIVETQSETEATTENASGEQVELVVDLEAITEELADGVKPQEQVDASANPEAAPEQQVEIPVQLVQPVQPTAAPEAVSLPKEESAVDVVVATEPQTQPAADSEVVVEVKEPSPILAQLAELFEPCSPVVSQTKSEEMIAEEKVLEPRQPEEESLVTSIDSIIDALSGCDNITSLSKSLEQLKRQSKPGSPEANLFAQLHHYAISSVPIEDSDKWSTKSGRSIRRLIKKSFSRQTYPQILSSTTCKIKAILPPFLSLSSNPPLDSTSTSTLPTPPPTAPADTRLAQKPSRPRLFPKVTMRLLNSSWLPKSRRSSVVAVDCH